MREVIPEDDLIHPAAADSNFNESMYYNFYDAKERVGGFMRIGNRVNESHAEMTLCVYLPNGHVLFDYQRYPIASNEAFRVDRMSFDVLEPLVRHRTTYSGNPIEMADPLALLKPGEAFRSSPRLPLEIKLVHEAVAPLFEPPPYDLQHPFALELPRITSGERSMAEVIRVVQRHNEQHMRIRGTVTVGGSTVSIDGLGMRDHSWGPRTWATGGHSRWLTVSLRDNLGLMVQDLGREQARLLTGVLVRDGKLDWMTSFDIQTEWKGLFQERIAVHFKTESGEEETLLGRVLNMVPLRHMGTTTVTRVGEGLTEYRLGDVVGYGLSEYFDSYPLDKEERRA